MISKGRFGLMTATVLIIFVLSTMWTSSALADDTAPPPVEPTIEVPPPVDEPVAIPEGTDVVDANESGDAIPLASQEAADAIATGDPLWCPTGVAPKASTGGCSASFGSLSALAAGPSHAANGTIWIENVADTGLEATFDGTPITGNWASAANFSLTLQGGWNGVPLSKGILGVSTFDTAINIINWNGAVTVNDITMQGAPNTSFPTTGALFVATKKNIVLSNVTAINTASGTADGAYLDNSSSTTQATVTVKNSTFNNNTSSGGLVVISDGVVTLTNISASNNKNYGVYIDNRFDLVASAVTINNGSFNGSTAGGGLEIYSNGAVKLSQVTANGNSGIGVYADNGDAASAQPVTVIGSLNAFDNGGSGLEIYSRGVVNLTNLSTNGNGGYGTYVDNTYATTAMAINVTGTNFFNYNVDGLRLDSEGIVTLNNLNADSNSAVGVTVDNTYASTPMAVNIKGLNYINSNGGNGLAVYSEGAITVNSVTANSNGYAGDFIGVFFNNDYDTAKPQNVTLTGYNYFLHNAYHGLGIESYGAITINNVTAIDNGNGTNNGFGSGVFLDNHKVLSAKPMNITVNGTNLFTNNDNSGIEAYSKGIITLSNVTVSYNGGNGAWVDNSYGTLPKAVILKGTNVFDQNVGRGLTVYSLGSITLNNITANANGGQGAYLFNAYGTQSAVVITGFGRFESNDLSGLIISSHGAITTSNLTAWDNGDDGVNINTIGITAPQAVTLNGTNIFNSNGDAATESGPVVNADGTIKLNNVTANDNFYRGVDLNNFTNWDSPVVNFATFGSVLLTGYGNFYSNGNDGLNVYTHGAATLNYATSSFNGDDGIGIDADGSVTLVCSSANNNAWGLYIYGTPTLITLKGLIAAGNATNEFLGSAPVVRTRCP